MLDLVGRIPTVAEAQRFQEADWASTVESLLADPSFDRYQAHELNWLIFEGKTGAFRDYLRRSVENDVRWDQIFAETMKRSGWGRRVSGWIGAVFAGEGSGSRQAGERCQRSILWRQYFLCAVSRSSLCGGLDAGNLLWNEVVLQPDV